MNKLYKAFQYLLNSICYIKLKNPLLISAWVTVRLGKVVARNWGDELNVHLLELLTGRKVLVTNASLWHINSQAKKYICIGSILGWYETNQSEIWGAGAMSENVVLKRKVERVNLVRGKYTRQLLLNIGIECPECYGDPALILSKLYTPKITRRYRMGIIPHYIEENQSYILEYVKSHTDVCLISMSNYNNWTDVIDKVASCDFIASSSLHGLIVSDSYGIPNLWVNFSEGKIKGCGFKFRDYFSSVKRNESQQPVRIREVKDLDKLYNLTMEEVYEGVEINYDAIFNSCPFIKCQR